MEHFRALRPCGLVFVVKTLFRWRTCKSDTNNVQFFIYTYYTHYRRTFCISIYIQLNGSDIKMHGCFSFLFRCSSGKCSVSLPFSRFRWLVLATFQRLQVGIIVSSSIRRMSLEPQSLSDCLFLSRDKDGCTPKKVY